MKQFLFGLLLLIVGFWLGMGIRSFARDVTGKAVHSLQEAKR